MKLKYQQILSNMTKTDILMDYFDRENDNIYQGGKQNFVHNYESFQILSGGAVTNTIKREKKINRQKRLEELNKMIRDNKKEQIRLLYDVTYEQINIEDEEGITNTQTQLDSDLKKYEKERDSIRKEMKEEELKKLENYNQSKMNIEINMEILKNKNESIQKKQSAFYELEESISLMYDVKTKREIYEVDVPSAEYNSMSGNLPAAEEKSGDVEIDFEELSDTEI